MMMMHLSYSLDLIALTLATALFIWSLRTPGKGSWLGKIIGIIVMALTIISIICMYACSLRGECHKPMNEEAAPAAATATMGHEEHKKMMEHKHAG